MMVAPITVSRYMKVKPLSAPPEACTSSVVTARSPPICTTARRMRLAL